MSVLSQQILRIPLQGILFRQEIRSELMVPACGFECWTVQPAHIPPQSSSHIIPQSSILPCSTTDVAPVRQGGELRRCFAALQLIRLQVPTASCFPQGATRKPTTTVAVCLQGGDRYQFQNIRCSRLGIPVAIWKGILKRCLCLMKLMVGFYLDPFRCCMILLKKRYRTCPKWIQ